MIRSGRAGGNLKSESGGRGAFGLAKIVSLAKSLYLRRFACMILFGSVAALRKRFILYQSLIAVFHCTSVATNFITGT